MDDGNDCTGREEGTEMSALDEVIKHTDRPQNDEGWIEYGLMLLWSETDGYEHVADNAAEEIVAMREELAYFRNAFRSSAKKYADMIERQNEMVERQKA